MNSSDWNKTKSINNIQPNVVKKWENRHFHTLLFGVQNGIATFDNNSNIYEFKMCISFNTSILLGIDPTKILA